ncbi:hypothetical protein PLICRDRAFT_225804 [Plicaturopsis crispa FD-325 SS-3]|nr:hypothetical protein PLICRDRAFT_225804 [Plicaturopsis crispa FD-325 SS-3]
MPSKTVHSRRSSSASSSDGNTGPPNKRMRTVGDEDAHSRPEPSHSVKVHIVQAKINAETVAELFALVESSSAHSGFHPILCDDARAAEVVVTAIATRQRLERHIDWVVAKTKSLVTPKWLAESARQGKPMPCGDFAAIRDLREQTVRNCPDSDDCGSSAPSSPQIAPLQDIDRSTDASDNFEHLIDHTSRFACCRRSPIVCPNQALVAHLDIIRHSRDLEGEDRSALSYARAISVIKAFPHTISSQNLPEVAKLPYLGPKLNGLIKEFTVTGKVVESENIAASIRFQALCSFTTVHGIGPTTARRLYSLGFRTIEDLEEYYGANKHDATDDGTSPVDLLTNPDTAATENGPNEEMANATIKVALELRDDLAEPIPRTEVEEMQAVVMQELDGLQKGCTSTIVGGYRRGKSMSNDVDMVITHPHISLNRVDESVDKVKGLCRRLVRKLYDRGVLTHVMHLSGFHVPDSLRTSHWDSLEKALTVFVMPSDGSRRRVHRRLDIIFAAPEVYWTAVVGWTGSKMFERDLRLWAKEKKGLKFDSSGITRRRDSKPIYPASEREVFETFGLPWIDPALRNADA